MTTTRNRELTFALLLTCSIVALPSLAAEDALQPSGAHRSSDAPRGWTSRNSGLDGGAQEVAISPVDSTLMYAAAGRGIYKTANQGYEWTFSGGVPDALAVVIDPKSPAVVYASNADGAKKTTDGGTTWTELRPNPSKLSGAFALAIDPSNPSTVYACLVENGVSKSTDGGLTFSFINNGLPLLTYMDWSDFGVSAFAVDPSKPSTLFTASLGILKSTNGGVFWSKIFNGPPFLWPKALAVDPSQSAFVYAATNEGLYRSSDGGVGWQRLQNEFSTEWITDVVVDPSDGRNVYVSTQPARGVYKSSDRGETWTAMNEGLPAVQVSSLAIDSTGTVLAAVTSGGVFTFSTTPGITLPTVLRAERLGSDPGRLKRLLEQVRTGSSGASESISSSAGLLFAVAGNVAGGLGTYFRSDVTLVNGTSVPQDVVAVWLAAGVDGTDAPSVRLALAPTAITVTDFVGKMGFSGLGSLLFIAVDSELNADEAADLKGFSRIWTSGPEGRGSVSQSLPAVDIGSLGRNSAAAAIGLRMDPVFRTNAGVVNLDALPHDFVLTARGERKSATFTIKVEALSMRHVPLPEGDYGELTALYETTGAAFPWTAYGSSVDNVTGDGWASQAVGVHRQQGAQR